MPPLDWPLPNQFGQFELKIEVQPKAHHRAHYETEGSRGAVKASSGGHPLVKVGSQHGCGSWWVSSIHPSIELITSILYNTSIYTIYTHIHIQKTLWSPLCTSMYDGLVAGLCVFFLLLCGFCNTLV